MPEFETKYPVICSPENFVDLRNRIHLNNWEIAKGALSTIELETAYRVAKSARKVGPVICSLPGNEGKTGFVTALTLRYEDFPSLTFQVGTVNDTDELYLPGGKLEKYCIFANLKIQVLIDNPEFISSSQNLLLPVGRRLLSPAGQEIPGGALAIGDWILSVSAFRDPNMDTAATLAMAVGAKLTGIDKAEKLAMDPRVNCREFMIYEDKLINPFLH